MSDPNHKAAAPAAAGLPAGMILPGAPTTTTTCTNTNG